MWKLRLIVNILREKPVMAFVHFKSVNLVQNKGMITYKNTQVNDKSLR